MIKQILIAVDNSEVSKRASKEGIELAMECMAEAIGLYVIDVEAFNIMDIGSEELARLKSQQAARGKEVLESLENLAKSYGIKIKTVLTEGEPAEEIVKAAKKYKADLIVMGTHGRRGIKKLIDGSVSEQALREAPCPVMVAHC